MNKLVIFSQKTQLKRVYVIVNSQLSLSENTFSRHVFYILRYSRYSVYNIWLRLVRSSSYNNTVSMYYIIIHYNDPLTNTETYMYACVCVCTDM